MEHFERIWKRGPVGRYVLILLGLLVVLLIVSIPIGIIISIIFARPPQGPVKAATTVTAEVEVISPTGAASPSTPFPLGPRKMTLYMPVIASNPSARITVGGSTQVRLTITSTNDYVNVRSGPAISYTLVSSLTKGQTVAVTGRNDDSSWWQIDANGKRGWVYGPLVVLTGSGQTLPVVQP